MTGRTVTPTKQERSYTPYRESGTDKQTEGATQVSTRSSRRCEKREKGTGVKGRPVEGQRGNKWMLSIRSSHERQKRRGKTDTHCIHMYREKESRRPVLQLLQLRETRKSLLPPASCSSSLILALNQRFGRKEPGGRKFLSFLTRKKRSARSSSLKLGAE